MKRCKNIFLMSLLVLTGCKHKQKSVLTKNDKAIFLEESVARIADIPDAPLGFEVKQVVQDLFSKPSTQIVYQAKSSNFSKMQDVEKSYMRDMESLGWRYSGCFQSEKEIIMIFERPRGKKCVAILNDSGVFKVTITTKKEASETQAPLYTQL